MQGSEHRDDRHSTPVEDPRPRLRWRFVGSVMLIAFLVGMMLGRLFDPPPLRIEDVEPWAEGLQLLFNREPQAHAEPFGGALVYRYENAYGREREGQLNLALGLVNWRVQRDGRDLLLVLVSPRPLAGQWHGAQEDGRWRARLALRPE
ncbi:hypothetical protein [Ectopseudomonas hydrolytica]|uniref:hypothetical protein n=1 Tax=Ectopseudomonas hydrolytica TaxID=2493633 RepID=UPI0020B80CEB|nr:hypothetical protein [Pseudomonas hydrolytica]UTH31354.1 hypothetical protein NLY38_23455 [Pseudomonas hydrolytica]